MSLIVYIILAYIVTYVGKIERPLNIGLICIPLAVPLGVFTAICCAFLLVLYVKIFFLIIGILLLLITKLKAFIGAKLAALTMSMGVSFLGLAFGPIAWLLLFYLFIWLLFICIVESFKQLYFGFLRVLAVILVYVRKVCDLSRQKIPARLGYLIFFIELPSVTGLSAKGLFELMVWVDGKKKITPFMMSCRMLVITLFIAVLYYSYLKSTTGTEENEEGIDIPLPIDISGSITSHIGSL